MAKHTARNVAPASNLYHYDVEVAGVTYTGTVAVAHKSQAYDAAWERVEAALAAAGIVASAAQRGNMHITR